MLALCAVLAGAAGEPESAQSLRLLEDSLTQLRARMHLAMEKLPSQRDLWSAPPLANTAQKLAYLATAAGWHELAGDPAARVWTAPSARRPRATRPDGARKVAREGARRGRCRAQWVDENGRRCVCEKVASFGSTTSRRAHFCKRHRPAGFVNVRLGKCQAPEGCKRAASFGPVNSTLALTCVGHAKRGYHNVRRPPRKAIGQHTTLSQAAARGAPHGPASVNSDQSNTGPGAAAAAARTQEGPVYNGGRCSQTGCRREAWWGLPRSLSIVPPPPLAGVRTRCREHCTADQVDLKFKQVSHAHKHAGKVRAGTGVSPCTLRAASCCCCLRWALTGRQQSDVCYHKGCGRRAAWAPAAFLNVTAAPEGSARAHRLCGTADSMRPLSGSWSAEIESTIDGVARDLELRQVKACRRHRRPSDIYVRPAPLRRKQCAHRGCCKQPSYGVRVGAVPEVGSLCPSQPRVSSLRVF